ncbi:hypothetical protein Ahy_B02g059333 [Arachis hypogaea]|uniref:Myb/SANT-like domain-containing protein n=1 Tax=Arachis hypogaea TaxID=3818 RepID=A0A445AGH0_ARAHY|nr:hypothetical protein Ahy_B02g059333 [Arachis hypogaea]
MDNENIKDANLEDRTNVMHDSENQVTSTDVYQPKPIQILTCVREELEKRQHICVASLSYFTVHALYILELLSQYRPRQINDENLEIENRHTQLMMRLLKSEKWQDVIRMSPEVFKLLCQKLRGTGRVKDLTRSTQIFFTGNKTTETNHLFKDNLRWSDEMDEVLSNALSEEALKGNRHDGSWTTEAYANVVKTLSIAIGPHITKNHIKNRMKILKDHFVEAYDLFHHLSGFAWSPVTKKFEAEEEVWQDFIKELFRADRATDKGAATSRERIQQFDRDPIDLNDSFEHTGFSDIDVNMGHDTPTFSGNLDSPSALHSQPNQLGGTSTSRGTKRKSPMNDFLEAQYEKVALEITTMADAIKEGSYLSSKLHDVAQRQVESVERQVSVAERQVAIAKNGLAIMQQSRHRLYSNQMYEIC